MIIIHRALSQKKEKRERPNKKGKAQKKGRDNATILFFILVLQSSTMIFMIESLLFCHFHILMGILHYRPWLVYSNNGLPQMPQVFVSKQVRCTPTQFLLLSFHTFMALVHPLHDNPYSLTLISIDGHLHSPLIRLDDVRPSSSFLSSPQPPFYSTYSAMSMAHAHVLREKLKKFENTKV